MKRFSLSYLAALAALGPVGASGAVVLTDLTFKAGAAAQANGSLSFAWQGKSNGDDAIAMGAYSDAPYDASIALGYGARTLGVAGIAIGVDEWTYTSVSPLTDPTEFYYQATKAGTNSVAIGGGAQSISDSVSIGRAAVSEEGAIALGFGSSARNGSIALSAYSFGAAYNFSIAIEGFAENESFAVLGGTARNGSIAIGDGTIASQGNVALGRLNRDTRRDGTPITATASPLDPVLEIGNPVFVSTTYTYYDDGQWITEPLEYWDRRNAMSLYRDNVARFEGPVQIKSGSGYVTLAPAGATQGLGDSTVLTLPTTGGELLSTASTIDATKLTGPVPAANLAQVVKVNTQGYAVADGAVGGVLRVLPAGDIPMFGQ